MDNEVEVGSVSSRGLATVAYSLLSADTEDVCGFIGVTGSE
jgi:hypothetical protein